MLIVAFNATWRDHLTNDQLYGNPCPVLNIIKERRFRFAKELKTKLLVKLFCRRLHKEALIDDDKPTSTLSRFLMI